MHYPTISDNPPWNICVCFGVMGHSRRRRHVPHTHKHTDMQMHIHNVHVPTNYSDYRHRAAAHIRCRSKHNSRTRRETMKPSSSFSWLILTRDYITIHKYLIWEGIREIERPDGKWKYNENGQGLHKAAEARGEIWNVWKVWRSKNRTNRPPLKSNGIWNVLVLGLFGRRWITLG